jgi:hypothetical protein
MQLTGADVEAAFVATAREQVNGEPFNWSRAAELLNARLAEHRYQRAAAFILGPRAPDNRQ